MSMSMSSYAVEDVSVVFHNEAVNLCNIPINFIVYSLTQGVSKFDTA